MLTLTLLLVIQLAGDFGFTEGPAADAAGNVFFVDDAKSKIYRWDVAEQKLSVFVENSKHANGMYFDKNGDLIVCEGETGCVVSYNKAAQRSVIAATFNGKRFNKPNDLWIAPDGAIYFTDPVYGAEYKVVQDGEYVYRIAPDRKTVSVVITDLKKPNGIVGTHDGKTLYVNDNGNRKVWRYTISADGSLADKTLFCNAGYDGMTLDENGNVYVTDKEIIVYRPSGEEIRRIECPQQPANVCFGGKDRKTLFITARTGFYCVEPEH
ncbi:gluconolactonase [Planctomycetales bacterium]|nr:gluconolactonase [Planctomycetales bacterium]